MSRNVGERYKGWRIVSVEELKQYFAYSPNDCMVFMREKLNEVKSTIDICDTLQEYNRFNHILATVDTKCDCCGEYREKTKHFHTFKECEEWAKSHKNLAFNGFRAVLFNPEIGRKDEMIFLFRDNKKQNAE